MKKVIITGFIKTSSPLHIAAPGNARFDPATGNKIYEKDKGVPLTTVQTMGIPGIVETRDTEGNVQAKTGLTQIPVIAANNIAGRLRRMAADVYLEALQARGQKVNITTYSAIKTGAATGNPDGRPITYDEYRRAKTHPFLGLFGGGPRMIKRKGRIFNAPVLCLQTKDLLGRNRIPYGEIYGGWEQMLAVHQSNLPASRMLGIWSFRRNDELRDLMNVSSAENSIQDFRKVFDARQQQIIEDFKKEKGEKGESKASVFTFQSMEFVVPGASFPFVAVLEDPTDAQVGLWLSGFERFVQNESIGGWSRNGFGNFIFEDGRIAVVEDGNITVENYSPSNPDNSDPESFRMKSVLAWVDAAESVEAEEIEWLMRLPEDQPKKGKNGKVKDAAEN